MCSKKEFAIVSNLRLISRTNSMLSWAEHKKFHNPRDLDRLDMALAFSWFNMAFDVRLPLRKHAYSYILKILPPKNENFQIKNSDIFHVSAQNLDCGYSLEPPYRGGSNEYPQSMFLSRNKENNVYPCKPQFYYIKVRRFKGVKII